MKCYDTPDKLIRMVNMMCKDMECAVSIDGEKSEWFNVKTWISKSVLCPAFSSY